MEDEEDYIEDDEDGNIFKLIEEECYYDDLWLAEKERKEKAMNEILDFINSNLVKIMRKGSGRLDYVTEDKTRIKIYKCGKAVTRIDIVKEEK